MTLHRSTFLLLAALLHTSAAVGAEESGDPRAAPGTVKAGEATISVGVFYATNRKRHADRTAEDTYGGERGEPHLGHCNIEFTPIPLMDGVASKVPFYVPSETNKVKVVEQADPRSFWDNLSQAVGRSSTRSAVVFIHGYNYGFARTCRMAAEMQRKLEGKSAVVMLSWPSNGNPADYVPDKADVEWSVPFLARFIAMLSDRTRAGKVHVLAHSLGSRGIVYALERLRADRGVGPVIGQLVFLAPDFDSETFMAFLPRHMPLAEGITLYASSNDAALRVSRQLHGHPRLGEAGEFLTIAEGMETIDVTSVGRYRILGHQYFYYHPLVAADLGYLLTTGKRAAERPNLRPETRDGNRYWTIVDAGER